MKGIRTYYCEQCKKCIDFPKNDTPLCKCGRLFGTSGSISDYINMRKTWSGQTKIEFSTTTIDKSIENMNKGSK